MKFFAALLCLVGLAAAYDDGQYRGEGLLESQDHYGYNNLGYYGGHYAGHYAPSAYAGHYAPHAYAGHYYHGAAPLAHDGRVVDTPEVAHAKAAHFAAHAAASHGAHAVAVVPAYHAGYYGSYHHGAAPLAADGRVVDTPEVAHAKAAHFAAKAAATHGAHGYYGSPYAGHYAGAYHYGAAPLAHDGRVVDTPEVAHAKATHFAAHAAASHGAHYYGHH